MWCTCKLNTKLGPNGPQPIVYGVSYDRQMNVIQPAHFTSQEPDLPIRSASRTIISDEMLEIYNPDNDAVIIPPFTYSSNTSFFETAIKLPDNIMLQEFSTSPLVEPPRFCKLIRDSYRVFIDNPKPFKTLFPDGKPRVYKMNSTGIWNLIEP